MRSVQRTLDALATFMLVVGLAAAAAMALHVTADVAGRFLFRRPLAGTLELVSHYYMVALTFAPLAFVQRTNGHVAAELFTRALAPRARDVQSAIICLLMGAFAALLAWRTGIEAMRATAVSMHVQAAGYFIYTWPARWLLPVGLGAMALYALLQSAHSAVAAARR